MSNAINFIIVAVIFQYVNLDDSQQLYLLSNVFSSKNVQNTSDIVLRSVCDPFKCHEYYLWHRMDLRQWQRRRRMSNFLMRKLNDKTVNGSVGELKAHKQILDVYSATYVTRDILIEKFKERWPIDKWRRYGLFTDDYLMMINPHWLQFPPPYPVIHYIFGSFYMVMLCIGCFGNILVLFMYCRFVIMRLEIKRIEFKRLPWLFFAWLSIFALNHR